MGCPAARFKAQLTWGASTGDGTERPPVWAERVEPGWGPELWWLKAAVARQTGWFALMNWTASPKHLQEVLPPPLPQNPLKKCLVSSLVSPAYLSSTCHEVQTLCAAEATSSLNLTWVPHWMRRARPWVFLTRTCPAAVAFCAFLPRKWRHSRSRRIAGGCGGAAAAPQVLPAARVSLREWSQALFPPLDWESASALPSRLCSCRKEMIRTALEKAARFHLTNPRPCRGGRSIDWAFGHSGGQNFQMLNNARFPHGFQQQQQCVALAGKMSAFGPDCKQLSCCPAPRRTITFNAYCCAIVWLGELGVFTVVLHFSWCSAACSWSWSRLGLAMFLVFSWSWSWSWPWPWPWSWSWFW